MDDQKYKKMIETMATRIIEGDVFAKKIIKLAGDEDIGLYVLIAGCMLVQARVIEAGHIPQEEMEDSFKFLMNIYKEYQEKSGSSGSMPPNVSTVK